MALRPMGASLLTARRPTKRPAFDSRFIHINQFLKRKEHEGANSNMAFAPPIPAPFFCLVSLFQAHSSFPISPLSSYFLVEGSDSSIQLTCGFFSSLFI
jgi:hypothetical protein